MTLDERSDVDNERSAVALLSKDTVAVESDRRTVIWHATTDVLESALVDRCFIYKGGRLRRHYRAKTASTCSTPLRRGSQASPVRTALP
mgnify:CR=1 FL=1